jgi:hypothetical protein
MVNDISSGGSGCRSRRRYEADAGEYLTHIPAKVNDFVGMDDDGAVLFTMMHGADPARSPLGVIISSTVARAVSVDNFPQSGRLCRHRATPGGMWRTLDTGWER